MESLCPKCLNIYDQDSRLPRILPHCGHSLCSSCVKSLIQSNQQKLACPVQDCLLPLNSRLVENFPINYALKQCLMNRDRQEMCQLHDKKLKIVCLVDKCQICNYCVQYGDHKDHQTKLIKQVQNEAQTMYTNCRLDYNLLKKCHNDIEDLLQEKKEFLQSFMLQRFEELREILDRKKQQIMAEINFFFDVESYKAEEILGPNSLFEKNMEPTLDRLSNIFKDAQSFGVLEEEPLTNKSKPLHELLMNYMKDLQVKIDERSQSMESFIQDNFVSKIREFSFPVKNLSSELNNCWKNAACLFKE